MTRPTRDGIDQATAAGRLCRTNGFAWPVPVVSATHAQECYAKVQKYEQQYSLIGDDRFKIHLLLPWAWDLVHHPVIVALAQAALATNDVWCWSTDINTKNSFSATHYSWHQDSTFAGIEPPSAAVTIWLALTPSMVASGCLRCVPGPAVQLPHWTGSNDATNALSHQQCIVNASNVLDLSKEQAMELQPGQASIHSFFTPHTSGPNSSSYRRIGLAMRFVSAHAGRTTSATTREMATLVSGAGHGLFDAEMAPEAECGERERAQHREALQREKANYFQSSEHGLSSYA